MIIFIKEILRGDTMTGKEAIERLEKQYKRQNNHIKENYDRVSITLPKGSKQRIKDAGESINGFICRLVAAELERLEKKQTQPKQNDLDDLPECFR